MSYETLQDQVKEYTEFDYEKVAVWFHRRGLPVPALQQFSDTGIIVGNVGAGFLYTTNSGVAIIDGYITNPEAPPISRGKAVRIITERLMDIAELRGFKFIKCDTQERTIERFAKAYGFMEIGSYKVFSRGL